MKFEYYYTINYKNIRFIESGTGSKEIGYDWICAKKRRLVKDILNKEVKDYDRKIQRKI